MTLNARSPRDWMLMIAVLVTGALIGLFVRPMIGERTADRSEKVSLAAARPVASGSSSRVTAIGRIRPGRGVVHVAGPSQVAVVVGKLLIEEGDRVVPGQAIAFLDSHSARKAGVERLRARLDAQIAEVARIEAYVRTGKAEFARLSRLHQEGATSESQLDAARLAADAAIADLRRASAEITLARADLREAEEELELTIVRSPVAGQVLKIHTREGERAGADGVAEIADTTRMYAVAEVYETDVAKIRLGQPATVTVPVLSQPVSGVVERVGLKVGKLDVLSTDPVARTDARVVEVEVRLTDGHLVSSITNMQVTVSIDTSPPRGGAAPAS